MVHIIVKKITTTWYLQTVRCNDSYIMKEQTDKVLRCSKELSRVEDCTEVIMPNKHLDVVVITSSIRTLKMLPHTRINRLQVETIRQFTTICDAKINQIHYRDQIKKMR